MKNLFSLILVILFCHFLSAQASKDSLELEKPADDPASFLTRLEVFNEFQHYGNGIDLNQTVIRNIIRIGKKFTTRIDVPIVHNSFEHPEGYSQFGIGDISFRLLGYKIKENPFAAFTASLEVQLNTAASPLLGTGKNLLIPVFTYSDLLKSRKDLISVVLQQIITVSGDDERNDLNFTKIQAIYLHFWSKRLWTVFGDEIFIDYEHDAQTSMIFKCRMTSAPTPRLNVWVQGNKGLYGDFAGRYDWGFEAGFRYFLLRSMNLNKPRLVKEEKQNQ